MLVCGDVRRTYAEVAARTRSVAACFAACGLGVRPRAGRARAVGERAGHGRPRAPQLHRVPRGDARRLPGAGRAVQRQPALPRRPRSAALLADARRARRSSTTAGSARWSPPRCDAADARARRRRRRLRRRAARRAARASRTSAATPVDGPLPTPSPDDLYLVCTGGTTGRPKAVLWRQADIYVSAMGGAEGATAESIAAGATAGGGGAWYAVPPLMHAAAQWTAFCGPAQRRDRRAARRLGPVRRPPTSSD